MSRQSTKNKKYALRKIGKVFGSCVVATVITLGGVAIMAPNVVYASNNESGEEVEKITDLSASDQGYEVRVPKGKKYVRNDKVEDHTPRLIHEGKNGRSFIKETEAEESEEMKSLFEKLYDEDNDGVIDAKYKRADADTINEHAGNPIAGTQFVEPKVSEVNPKYPHRVDAGVTNINDIYDSNNDGKPDNADGEIDENDTIVEANKPITVDPNAEKNVVKDDGTVVLSKYYRIHVNEGDTADKDDDIYEVGTKPKVVETPIDYPTRYERDDNIPEGEEHVEVAGKAGKTVTTTTYKLNETTGEVTPNEPETVTTDPVTKVVKRGTQPKVVETPIDYPTRYERDDNIPEGEEHVEVAGKAGKTVTTTTYEVDPNIGKVTENPSTSETTPPVTRVVKIGAQPKVEETPIPFTTRYEKDDESPKGKETEVTPGVDGKTVTTTTYEVDPNTGKVSENPSTSETTPPVTRVVKRGTQPKVEKTPIPFPTRYEDDNSIPEGEEREVTAGVNGETVKTTTYAINPDTGEVTANEPTSETTNPVTRVVKRGTQPKPGETPETPQPKPGETPETPQPKPGETPETPQPKPGETPETPQPEQPTNPAETPAQPVQPSEGEDQPDLKVAPPTIAIVEEPNKASFEVKAPKKDADTVKIIYPKSDGSGNEVLTLTKQPSGEWTLDKQPENVTLDKKTGTVTIPRESVVNKQKVQAQAKHKTSGYTPFVYAALSIEEANPEHPVTLWVDTAGTELKKPVVGKKEPAGEIAGYKWLSSRLEEGILTHTFEKVANGTPSSPESSTSHPMTPSSSPSTSTPEKPNKAETPAVRTVWRDENGKDLKVPSVDKQEAGEVPGYEFVESHREGDNLTVHVFRTKQAQTPAPKDQTPNPEQAASPVPSKVSEQKGEAVATATSEKTVDSATSTKTSDKAELPNTGTEANASLASAGIMTLLAGLGLGFFKKKED
ncbi:G5 domain-containing protein [Streptococcus sp. 2579]|uniref:G5 domain-containing protein n=1 Tax=Streptococcus sp. 2579 TaxID=2582648 RepID=UPI001564980F|nr:G5 domain-containing protein [Streptococcus sp. 2579]